MSHGVTPFAVSIAQIRKVVGSRSKSILRGLMEEFEEELENDREDVEEANGDEDFDPELPLEDALRHLIMDEERWDFEGAKYGFAIEMICSFYGEILANQHWSSVHIEWPDTVHDALVEAGVSEDDFSVLGHLVHRGSPVEIPDIDDFPYIGYVTFGEIPNALDALSDQNLNLISGEGAPAIRQSLEQIRDWLETCKRDKSDLVCFCY